MFTKTLSSLLGLLIVFTPFSLSLADPAYDSGLDRKPEFSDVTYYNKSNNSRLIRWKIGKSSYLGQTIVNGKTALGLELADGAYVYSIDHRSLSFTIRF